MRLAEGPRLTALLASVSLGWAGTRAQWEGPPPLLAATLEDGVVCRDAPSFSGEPAGTLDVGEVLFPSGDRDRDHDRDHDRRPDEWVPVVPGAGHDGPACFVRRGLVVLFEPDDPEPAVRAIVRRAMEMDSEDGSADRVARAYSVMFEDPPRGGLGWALMNHQDSADMESTRSLALEFLEGGQDGSVGTVGTVVGTVIDPNHGMALPGAVVEALGTGRVAHTDLDGRYRLDLPEGEHDIRVSMPGYAEQTVTLDVVAGRSLPMEVELGANVFSEEVTVSARGARADSSTAAAQMEARMGAPVVQDNIGAAEMRSNNDSDVAEAMRRVTGVSVAEDQSVLVRGLGERYSNTTLAGVTLPTTQPDRRVIPLDLFPSGLIDSVQVSKTYTPDKSPQFAGGLVEIMPKKSPGENSYEFSLGGALNTLTTGRTGLGHGGGYAWHGFDGGARALPPSVPDRKVVRGGRFTSDELGFLRNDLERFGESFGNVWDPVPDRRPMSHSYNGLFGGRFGNLGVIATALHSQNSQMTNERRTFYKVGQGGGIERFNGPYDFETTRFTSRIGGVGNIAHQFNPNHSLSLNNFYTHVGTDETRTFGGFNSDADNDIRNQRLFFTEEQIRSHIIGGDHLFPGISNSRLDWRLAFTHADRSEPDLREVLYEFDPARGSFVLADESRSGLRQFNDLEDDSLELNMNWSTLTRNWTGMPAQIKFGASYIDRDRDFLSRRFRFAPINVSGLDLSRRAEQLFTQEHIGPNFQLKEETRPTDQYDASQNIASAYGMLELPLAVPLRLVTGARVEHFSQRVNTHDPFARAVFGDDLGAIQSSLDEIDVFPAVNLVYAVRSDQNLRFGFSQTVNRPEFRELAPFEFTDVVGGRAMSGNPDLQRSLIQNLDVRWEFFPGPGEEVAALGFFYKHFRDPIERIVEPTAQLRTSFTNARAARNAGIEIEGRKAVGRHLFAGFNYTHVDSEVELSPASRQVQTSLVRPLAGTSENLFNTFFEVRGRGHSGRLLWNYHGDRISDVGSLGLPDIVQRGRGGLDLVFSNRLHRRANLKIAVENLTDGAYVFSQGGEPQRTFRLGRTVSFGVTIRP